MTEGAAESVADALERSISAAAHLTARDAAAVAAARVLAARIDTWHVIVKWAQQDAGSTARPRVPAQDNVSLGTYLKYLETLQLVPPAEHRKPGPPSSASDSQQMLNQMRDQVRTGRLTVVPEVEGGHAG